MVLVLVIKLVRKVKIVLDTEVVRVKALAVAVLGPLTIAVVA